MVSFHFEHVCIESYALNLPRTKITTAEIEQQLAPLYQKLGIPLGTLEKLSGVSSRYFFPSDMLPSAIGTVAASRALEMISFPREEVRGLFSCSVTRDYFEPATACLIHQRLNLPEESVVMDISNACIGFSDGMMMMASLIEAGVVPAGVVVSAEGVGKVHDSIMRHLLSKTDITRDELLKLLPTLTLGAGSVAMVLAHDTIAKNKHRIIGAASRADTEASQLCIGNGDFASIMGATYTPIMETESSKLLASAAKLGGRTWQDASKVLGWSASDVDHIFCHQVGKQVNDAFYREMGLEREKEFIIYPEYGNLISAACPTALVMGIERKGIKAGDKVLMTAFGSGLNAMFIGIEW